MRRSVSGNLAALRSPLDACRAAPDGEACGDLFHGLKNPYFIRDDPALTQTCGWVDAWTAQPSAYAVAAHGTADVVAAVNFARENNLRLVVKGGGHSYLGGSSAADSLLIWTRPMDGIEVHDAFVPQGCEGQAAPLPAVTVGAGAIWMHAYDAVTTRAGRYVQGGGCGTVGVAGLLQGGGFGTHSKAFGTAGSSLLEAEVVTADGAVRVANARREPELFWALKGGGGGSFGVVTRLTLRTWDLPASFGAVSTSIRASSDDAYRRLLGAFVAFYAESLCNPHWGELAQSMPGNRLEIGMNFQGLDKALAEALWRPFLGWVAAQDDLVATPPAVVAGPGRYRWDGAMLERRVPGVIRRDDRPGAAAANFFWAANLAEAGHVIHDFESLWLPADLLRPERQGRLADALAAASRHWTVEMHFQKGLAGAPASVCAAALDTPMNPMVADSFMLAIVASEGPPAFPGLPGHGPDMAKARHDRARIARAMAELRAVAPEGGAYVAESSYFQPDWQRAYWGPNYPRLLAAKRRYDPDGLFFVRHGVGSEGWSEDGFERLA
ncbi:MAG: FAD-binding oxidoreductase [Acetobacteraceae bacterium]|nr:FAD-binding oxidoreductase [Acetobacteraceae bacterium]